MLNPDNEIDTARWEHTRLRRNIQDGRWEMEILWRMKEQYGLNNVNNMGRPSMSVNLFSNTVDQTALLYDTPSVVANTQLDENTSAIWSATVDGCHMWQLLQENCRKVIGLREGFIQLIPTQSGIQLEIVTPDEIIVTKTSGDASTITAMQRARTFMVPNKDGDLEPKDLWECWDISDTTPIHEVKDAEGTLYTSDVYPPTSGPDGAPVPHTYIWVDEDGPYLPWAFYRGRYTSNTFDPYWGSELVHGTLDIAIHWTMWGVCLRNNSWPQWWIMDADVPGLAIAETINGPLPNPPDTIELAPNSILRFKSDGASGAGKVGQLPPADAKAMGEAILTKQNTILNNVGIHPDDLSQSANAQSGVAIQLKRSAQRKIAMSYIPVFRDADIKLFGLMARVHNTFYAEGETDKLPTTGWYIDYNLPEASADEFLADLTKDEKLIELGLKSRVDLCQKLYSLDTPEEAVKKLDEIARYNQLYPSVIK